MKSQNPTVEATADSPCAVNACSGRSGPSAGARPRLRIVVSVLDQTLAAADRTQRSHRITAVAYGVVKKFGDDNLNQSVVGLGWYGCVGIYPLLLVVVTVFGFIGIPSL